MCGITAVVDPTRAAVRPTIEQMTQTLGHRGPDDTGVWQSPDGTVALGHCRLAVIDLSALGRNPMTLRQGRYWITYNGEVYNFRALRDELIAEGYAFLSETDTEVVLAAYDRWGLDCLDRFIGMFAFVLWDAARGRLLLARDRLGKKPLYYAQYGGRFAVASELKAIVADRSFPQETDPRALALYLRYGYVPAPLSIYRHASKLPPGHYAVLERGDVQVHRYWDPVAFADVQTSATEHEPEGAEARLEALLRDAVRLRTFADVPVGAFLSGGLDSSLIVALMQEHGRQPVKTFTIRFDNPEYDEADHAAAVARHLRTDHYEQRCSDQDMLAVVDRLPQMFDEPFADSSAIPTFLVSKIAREQVTVALSGDGGDELFLGYPRYTHQARNGWALSLPAPVRRAAAVGAARMPTRRLRRIADVLQSDDDDRHARFVTWRAPEDVAALMGCRFGDAPLYADALARTGHVHADARPALLDLVSYLPDDILTKVDRTSMAVSLEVRTPLLDHRVVEFALGLPPSLKRRGRTTKWLLRQVLYKRVPRALLERPKMGFGVPLDDWFRGPLRGQMDGFCAGADLEQLGIDPRPIRQLWATFRERRTHRTDLLWQIYALVAWSRRFRVPRRASSTAVM